MVFIDECKTLFTMSSEEEEKSQDFFLFNIMSQKKLQINHITSIGGHALHYHITILL